MYEIDRKVREHFGLDPEGARQLATKAADDADKTEAKAGKEKKTEE